MFVTHHQCLYTQNERSYLRFACSKINILCMIFNVPNLVHKQNKTSQRSCENEVSTG